jgi:hypothetical protein
VKTAAKRLERMRLAIEEKNERGRPRELIQRLCVTEFPAGVYVEAHADPFGEVYAEVLRTLATPDVAEALLSLELTAADTGANGTRHWDLEPLLAVPSYPRLMERSVQRTGLGDHNQSIVGAGYEEGGVLGGILVRAPRLQYLTAPSAPDPRSFFMRRHPIEVLSLDTGYDQDFIANLARSTAFPALRVLEWGEYNQTYMADFRSHCTPLESYHALFTSPAFANVRGSAGGTPFSLRTRSMS